MNTIRFGMSIDKRLLTRFDQLISKKGYVNRSEAIRDLIRNTLVEEQWEHGNEETFGTITLVYDHHTRELSDKLIEHQHAHTKQIISTLHVHIDAHHCLEVVIVKGKPSLIKKISNELIGTKGVKHGKLVTTTSGKGIA
ncbi:MAG: nickel-responsive transcriptional regulator NikR [Deltaproteobacteria bacterium]|jgi:CopG family transcriptional regulator, nickel-responsive regulator|nr:nickel-responsive transcriptional regulator NikR [Deltaproteobacteria bacterium]MBT4087832.1 nickel-responsive transcriptional regulator NikR [Deltaproteobacteria bacterium]MBT4268083.1 nickel-responsive transcriptional regulator NikR [Deltaproteobacteria bacterium]MBT4641449.1 nickel-responsive transcriptional regulator NikR [Deltaproteobacteria bacterium]MBT6500064.1 nickel-responsive transcriptional regulator NikR [Deltaproteobacteria bacterium]